MVYIQNYWTFGLFPSSDVKTKAKRLTLLRFESGFCFCLQLEIGKGGCEGNKPNQLGPFEWANRPVFESSSLKETQLITFITFTPFPIFTWRRKQNPLSKSCNFSLLVFVFTSDDGKSLKVQWFWTSLDVVENANIAFPQLPLSCFFR